MRTDFAKVVSSTVPQQAVILRPGTGLLSGEERKTVIRNLYSAVVGCDGQSISADISGRVVASYAHTPSTYSVSEFAVEQLPEVPRRFVLDQELVADDY
jgi:hypothetical protein